MTTVNFTVVTNLGFGPLVSGFKSTTLPPEVLHVHFAVFMHASAAALKVTANRTSNAITKLVSIFLVLQC